MTVDKISGDALMQADGELADLLLTVTSRRDMEAFWPRLMEFLQKLHTNGLKPWQQGLVFQLQTLFTRNEFAKFREQFDRESGFTLRDLTKTYAEAGNCLLKLSYSQQLTATSEKPVP